MSALKNAVLHLLHVQSGNDDPSLVLLARRHKEAVENEPIAERAAVEVDPEVLEANIKQLLARSLPKLTPDLPNGLKELPTVSIPGIGGLTTVTLTSGPVTVADVPNSK